MVQGKTLASNKLKITSEDVQKKYEEILQLEKVIVFYSLLDL
jgi:hypothetical protein